jgi:hypothetical protein
MSVGTIHERIAGFLNPEQTAKWANEVAKAFLGHRRCIGFHATHLARNTTNRITGRIEAMRPHKWPRSHTSPV